MVSWGAAFDCFALATEAVGVWEYHLAKAHFRVCCQIACMSFVVLGVYRVWRVNVIALQAALAQRSVGTSSAKYTTRRVASVGPAALHAETPTSCLPRRV